MSGEGILLPVLSINVPLSNELNQTPRLLLVHKIVKYDRIQHTSEQEFF